MSMLTLVSQKLIHTCTEEYYQLFTASGRGTLYTSDSTGEYYAISLPNHLVSELFYNYILCYAYVCIFCLFSM